MDKEIPRSAASRAAAYHRDELMRQAAKGMSLAQELGVHVKGGKVYRVGLARTEVGDLAGAFATITQVRSPGPLAGIVTGVPPVLCTTLVQCSNGATVRHTVRAVTPKGRMTTNSRLSMALVRQAVNQFNLLADMTAPSTDPKPPPPVHFEAAGGSKKWNELTRDEKRARKEERRGWTPEQRRDYTQALMEEIRRR
jgi:hypothetical protein